MLRLRLLAGMPNMQPVGCLQPRTATDATQRKPEACLKYCKTFHDLFCNPRVWFSSTNFTDDNVVSHCREVGHSSSMSHDEPTATCTQCELQSQCQRVGDRASRCKAFYFETVLWCLAFFPSFRRDSAGVASVCHHAWLI